jgi:hypothetical protein
MARVFEEPDVIAERVATQMGWSADEARMERWDRIAVETLCIGNDYPRKELH